MKTPLRVLHLEYDPLDAEFVKSTLEEEGIACDVVRVARRDDFINAINSGEFDLIFADYQLPGFDGLSALAMSRERNPGTPFILITGNIGEELAIEILKSGATDYVLKNRIARLAPAVRRALREAAERTARLQAASGLRESNEQLRQLAAHLQSVREEERTHVARDIHDELGQALAALKMDIVWLSEKYGDHAEVAAKGKSMEIIINETILAVKRICSELRPALLDHFGIGAAMEWQAEEFQKRSGVKCKVALEPSDLSVEMDHAIVLFRIFQEALTNVSKHARATSVDAVLTLDDNRLVLVINDNGVGISDTNISGSNSFGLIGMRERLYTLGGTIMVNGKKNWGTTLTVIIPLPEGAQIQ
jgi:two-component system, NarL family, sensor histidine kinase UhpB